MDRILNVAVATDTILYAPFYMALYGNDFKKTPWGPVKINIIGRGEDPYFKPDAAGTTTGVDGFVTMCLLFDYADVGICDPSYLVYLLNCTDFYATIKPPLEQFISRLKDHVLGEFYDGNTQHFSSSNHEPNYKAIEDTFKNKMIKVVGGLISKMAFAVVGTEDILTTNHLSSDGFPYISAPFFDKAEANTLERSIKEVVMFHNPSTGNYIAQTLLGQMQHAKPIPMEFGTEIAYIHSLSGMGKNAISLTCDYLSVDYVMEHKLDGKGIQLLAEYPNLTKNAMFTGIIANMGNPDHDLYYSFLYAIDKNLYYIHKLLSRNSSATLSSFIGDKLLKNPAYRTDRRKMLSFLVGYKKVEDHLLKSDDPKIVEQQIETLIFSYVKRLAKWERNGKYLYYPSIKTTVDDLQSIYRIRQVATNQAIAPHKIDWNDVSDFSLLDEWSKKERAIILNKKSIRWRFFTNQVKLIFFTSLFITAEVISIILKVIHATLEVGEKPLFKFMGIQWAGMTISWICIALFGIFIFIGVRMNLRIHYLKEYEEYVYDFNKGLEKGLTNKKNTNVWHRRFNRFFKAGMYR